MSQRRSSRNQPHLPIPIHARYRRCDPQKLVHVEAAASYLPHTPQSRYVPTYLFVLLHNGNLFYPFQLLSIPFTRSDSDSDTETASQIPYIPYLPRISSYQSIQSVNWSLAVSDSRSKTRKRHSGGGDCKQRRIITLLPIRGNFSKRKKLVLLSGWMGV